MQIFTGKYRFKFIHLLGENPKVQIELIIRAFREIRGFNCIF